MTPLVSPAIPPNYSEVFDSPDQYFTPLSSPALFPLEDQIKMSPAIGPSYRKSPLGLYSGRNPPPSPLPSKKRRPSLRQQIALASPKLPATPASLMQMSSSEESVKQRKLAPSPRTLRPLISPYLQPEIKNIPVVHSPEVENRRSAHKVAEQRRRDTLKQSFDSLRKEIVEVLIQDSDKPEAQVEKEVKLMSKVLLLQHSYEYIVRLKSDAQNKDERIKLMQEEIDKLKAKIQQ